MVHIAWDDSNAYAAWLGKRPPIEAEWEFAAYGGSKGNRYAWGNEERPGGRFMLNRWTGYFPYLNDASDGFGGTSPVGSFPANGYGLYDISGNVWNWCSDIYRADAFAERSQSGEICCYPGGPQTKQGEKVIPGDPSPPMVPGAERRVTKGGKNSRPSEHLAGWSVRKIWCAPHFGEKYESREFPIVDLNCPMKTTLLPEQISRIVRLAWEDRTSFEEIEKRTGLVERDVIEVMRRELKPSSFRLWRKRMNGRITKHRRLLERKLKGPPAADFDD